MNSGHATALRHRPDIDGLRALAVLPIVLFHAGVSALAGGFVGVDIFFVISGYLITAILLREIAGGRFSIAAFYHRRFVRILPALFVMLAVTVAIGCVLLLPSELAALAKNSAAAIGFSSNIYLWKTTGYFAAAAEFQPLLHTWSLGVEEQYYIFYPPLLWLVLKVAPNRSAAALWLITVASFALGVYLSLRSPSTAYYLLPARAWELALGGVISAGGFPKIVSAALRNVLALAGLALAIAGVVVIDDRSLFPAPWAMLPCAGAALLLAYGEATGAGRVLSLPAMRWFGAISYSLYLWHWPIITLYRLRFGMHLAAMTTALLLVVMTFAAFLSYRYVEQPFLRRFRATSRPGRTLWISGGAIAVSVAAALAVAAQPTIGRRFPVEVLRVAGYSDYAHSTRGIAQFRPGRCFAASGNETFDWTACTALDPQRPNLVLMGDSLAAQFWQALAQGLGDAHLVQVTASGCRPVVDGAGTPQCTLLRDRAFKDLASAPAVRGFILAGFWKDAELPALVETVRMLRGRGKAVTVIGPQPEWEAPLPPLLARAMLQGKAGDIDDYRKLDFGLDRRMGTAVRAAGGSYVSPITSECPDEHCRVLTADGTPVNFDTVHLTDRGAKEMIAGLPRSVWPE